MLALLFAAGCEDLKDTYDDYAGDGPVRYMARCTDVKVESGWECLRVFWKNASSSLVGNIIIVRI